MSTTPPGSPPKVEAFGNQNANAQQAPQQDTSAILAALANMAKQNPAAQPTAGLPGQGSLNSMLGVQNGNPALPPNVNGLPTANGQPVNPLGAIFAGMSNGVQQTQSPAPPNPFAAFLPQPQAPPVLPQAAPVPAPGSDAQQQQIQLLQILAAQGVPPDQWATALQLLNMQTAQPQTGVPGMPFPAPLPANTWPGQNSSSRDAFTRSPPNQYRRRSRSPGWKEDAMLRHVVVATVQCMVTNVMVLIEMAIEVMHTVVAAHLVAARASLHLKTKHSHPQGHEASSGIGRCLQDVSKFLAEHSLLVA